MNDTQKKILHYIFYGFITIVGVAIIFTAINGAVFSRNLNRRLREVETNISNIGEEVSASGVLIGQLETNYNGIAESVGKFQERIEKIDGIARAIEAGNRRQEEIFRNLNAGIVKIQSGFSGIESSVKKLSSNLNGLELSMGESFDLVREGLEILNKPGGNPK